MLLRRETLQTVRPATADADRRYALDQIQIEPDGACVATNGHILIRATEPDPLADADFPIVAGLPAELTTPTGPILMSADLADRLVKATPKRSSLPILATIRVSTNGDGSHYAAATDLTAPIVAHLPADPGVQFPKYAAVIPGARPSLSVTLGIPVLEALLKSAKATGTKGIRFELPTEKKYHRTDSPGDVSSAIVAKYHGPDVTATAILMPFIL